jgi:hypothetical protein
MAAELKRSFSGEPGEHVDPPILMNAMSLCAVVPMRRPELAQSRDPCDFTTTTRPEQAVSSSEQAAEPAQPSVGIDDRCVERIAEQEGSAGRGHTR